VHLVVLELLGNLLYLASLGCPVCPEVLVHPENLELLLALLYPVSLEDLVALAGLVDPDYLGNL
jgi:hypothetical protein